MGKDLNGKELGTGISQRKDGRYIGRFTNRFGRRPEVQSRNLKELKVLLNAAIYEDLNKLNHADDHMTLDEWFEKWMKNYKNQTICANTKQHYVTIYEKHISPTLGNKKMVNITQLKILEIMNYLDSKGYQYETRNKIRILMLDMFDKAMINEIVSKNPAKGIKMETKEKSEPKVLTPEDQASFFECSKGSFYDNLFTVAISTGLRPGELCGLTLEDIDFDAMIIDVNKTLIYQKFEEDEKKVFHFDPPKTKSSKRKVPMNQQCALALKKQMMQRNVIMGRRTAKPIKGFENLLFTTRFGTPINSQTFGEAVKRVIEEINTLRDELEWMDHFSPHCFRHSFTTRCFEAGIKPKTVQKYLGHASLQMTMDLYTHVLFEHSQEEMVKLEKVLEGTMEVSESMVDGQFKKFIQKEKDDNCVYLFQAT